MENDLISSIDGYGIELVTTDGTRLMYDASDGGCSLWEIEREE